MDETKDNNDPLEKELLARLLARSLDAEMFAKAKEIFNSCLTEENLRSQLSKYTGKEGILQKLMEQMKFISGQDRPRYGQRINTLKLEIEKIFDRELYRIKNEQYSHGNVLNYVNYGRPNSQKDC